MAKSAGNKTLSTAANLANLLPTGTVLAFQALLPSISNNGSCLPVHKYLTLSVIIGFSLVCFISSFTDSYVSNGKVYYGIAIYKSIYIFNEEDRVYDEENAGEDADKTEYGIRFVDFVHAFCSLLVFLVFASNDSDVQNCFFPQTTPNESALMMNLPLTVGAAVSFIFTLFPTTRRGIGYADSVASKK